MLRFLAKRILTGLLVLWGIVTLLFLIFNLLGDPAELMAGENGDEATRQAIRERYGLDRPLLSRYFGYLNDLSPIGLLEEGTPAAQDVHWLPLSGGQTFLALKTPNLQRSFQGGQAVSTMLLEKLPGTLVLAVAAMVLALLLGIPLGMLSALYRDRLGDRFIAFITLLGVSAPSFFVAVILIRVFAVSLGPWTGLHATGFLWEEEIFGEGSYLVWGNLVLPAVALGIRPLALITQLMRSSMIEVLGSDYIRTARAKGLAPRTVLLRHALPNALNPVVTSATGWFASLLAGAFFIETIFDWQGIGKLTIDALSTRDFPVILGAALVIGALFVLINLLTDLLYARLDPRVRLT